MSGVLVTNYTFAQADGFEFIPNKGQWPEPFDYKTKLNHGEIFFHKQGLIFSFWNPTQKEAVMEAAHHKSKTAEVPDGIVDAHGVYADFVGANPNPIMVGSNSYQHYYNYYLGNDPSKWQTEIYSSRNLMYQNVYDGINLSFYTQDKNLKYDWIVSPGADPRKIKLHYRGANSVAEFENGLHIVTGVNDWIEQKPYAYQIINGNKTEVKCDFVVKDDVVSFKIGKYDKSKELIIDPTLIFATYTGSAQDNWGFTATYDFNDNMYGAGIVFGNNAFPGNPGSFQLNFGLGTYDVLLCKFNSNGNNLLYYTYLGAASSDAPVSLVCNSNNEIFILGVTGSTAFPISPGAFQSGFGGGSNVSVWGLGSPSEYFSGTDLFITKLSANGTTLLGSTYVGGSGNDGLNIASGGLNHNYADEFRGEIIVDAAGNCYITSCTKSTNFPTQSPFQGSLQGGQDAIICKFNSTLTSMMYGSYLGGGGFDAGYSVQINGANEAYVTGGTTSSNFPTTAGVIGPAFSGTIDGFLTRISAGGALMNSTYLGTASYDQCYNVQLDNNNNPHVFGQTTGTYPVTGGVYSNPNSGQFIHKLNPNLSATMFSTVVGRGAIGQIDIVPTAFLVDVCDYIYLAGWGGAVNSGHGGGTTIGLPVTANAYQASTNGSDFYLMVLDNNATGLQYATYFGGSISAEHVDGGTSRFDKSGIVYEAVCAGCGSNNDFPTTPGAWSSTNNSNNCNLGVFKFDISQFTAIIDPITATTVCVNGVVTLNNASTGGFAIQWDFGDGTFSTDQLVNHSYAAPGTYWVYLEVFAPGACLISQKDSILITVEAPPVAQIAPVPPLCSGDSVQLVASGGLNYLWASSSYLSSTSIADPIAFPDVTTNFTVTVSNNCGSDDANITVTVINVNANAGPDVSICNGQNTQLNASGGNTYLWNNASSLNNPNVFNPIATPSNTTAYAVTVTDLNGCSNTDTVIVTVDVFPVADAGPDTSICFGFSYQLNATGGSTYQWSPTTYLNDPFISNPVSTPASTITYVVGASNSCGTAFDTITIDVIVVNASTVPDMIICPGDSVLLTATGGVTYTWSPNSSLVPSSGPAVMASPSSPTNYVVTVTDAFGCVDYDSVFVNLFPAQNINLGPNIVIPFGGETQLNAHGVGQFTWTPDSFLTCSNCSNPTANPFSSTEYVVSLIDSNGCEFLDTIMVIVEGSLYVPNTFTPNGDEMNNMFFAYGTEIASFKMWIFNRWGQEIFVSNSLYDGWDGYYKGQPCPLGVYVWKIDYEEISGKGGTLIGHVNLLR